MDAIEAANRCLAQGKADDAHAILIAAGDAGASVALAELASWYLNGTLVPRDLMAARAYLRRAAEGGHASAALMEVALTANGTGGPSDWPSAVALLRRAAERDPLAAQHMQLLSAMALDDAGNPLTAAASHLLHNTPHVQRFAKFCTPMECAHLASIAAPNLRPATVFDPATGKLIAHPIRSSENAPIGPMQESLIVQAINRRIAAATKTASSHGEPLTVLRYAPGQQYRPHLDTLPDMSNQRVRTAIVYLNNNYAGGETVFPLLSLKVTPAMGDLLVFDNVDEAGSPEPRSRHAGLPVARGIKWIATRWIRAKPISPWTLSDEARASA